MELSTAKRTSLIILTILSLIAGLTYLVSFLVRGYRPNFKKQRLGFLPTGLLVANSEPKGASVFIDGKLATATDDTINLSPKDYEVEIEKDGFFPWNKKLTIKKEIVTQTNTILFRSAPDLKLLTNTGAINPVLSPDKTKIVYGVGDASTVKKNGVWLLELTSGSPLSRTNTRQLTDPIGSINWKNSQFIWNPDNRSLLLVHKEKELTLNAYSINIDRFTPTDQLIDVSFRLSLILDEWQQEEQEELEIKLAKLPEEIFKIASESAEMVSFAPNDEKFFYLATNSATIPESLIPHPPARSTQPESRQIKPDNIYVYDIKEDTSFLIGTDNDLGINSLYWLTNNHLIYINQGENKVKVIEADATNKQTIYAGPFENSFVFPSPSNKSLIILTSLQSDSPGNLYEVKVR